MASSSMRKVENIFRRWHKRPHEKVVTADIPWPDVSDLTYYGVIMQIDYISDKWHKAKDTYYYHPIELNRPTLYVDEKSGICVIGGIQEARDVGLVDTQDGKKARTGEMPPPPSRVAFLGYCQNIIYLRPDGEIDDVRELVEGRWLVTDESGTWVYVLPVRD